ncbi:MAG: hypothetical protein C4310_10735, partial [Chloroflexota bacterium]
PDWPLLYDQAPVPVAVPGITPLGEWQLEAQVLPSDGWERTAVELNPDPWQAYLDYQVVQRMSSGALYLRRRQPGDRFRPLGLGGHRTRVSQLLINLKVPRPWRDAIPLLVAGDTILWVCGFRLDDTVRVTEHTQEVLHLRFSRVDDER